jgi:hypothetical protein
MAETRKPTLAEALRMAAAQPYAFDDAELVDAAVVLDDHDYGDLAHEMWEEAERRAIAPDLEASQ